MVLATAYHLKSRAPNARGILLSNALVAFVDIKSMEYIDISKTIYG